MMRGLREMFARSAVQSRVLVALIHCATMATEAVVVATESEEDVRFPYLGKHPMRFMVFWRFLCGFAVFVPPLRPTLVAFALRAPFTTYM